MSIFILCSPRLRQYKNSKFSFVINDVLICNTIDDAGFVVGDEERAAGIKEKVHGAAEGAVASEPSGDEILLPGNSLAHQASCGRLCSR